jgi:hypothetical protein
MIMRAFNPARPPRDMSGPDPTLARAEELALGLTRASD